MISTLKSNCWPPALEVIVPGGTCGPATNHSTRSAAMDKTAQTTNIITKGCRSNER